MLCIALAPFKCVCVLVRACVRACIGRLHTAHANNRYTLVSFIAPFNGEANNQYTRYMLILNGQHFIIIFNRKLNGKENSISRRNENKSDRSLLTAFLSKSIYNQMTREGDRGRARNYKVAKIGLATCTMYIGSCTCVDNIIYEII